MTRTARLLAAWLILLSLTGATAAQGLFDRHAADVDHAAPEASYGIAQGAFVAVPIPFSNPVIGSGLALGAGYLFSADAGSKPSVLGLGAFRTDNGSEGYGATINLALDRNRWLFTSFFGTANLNYDLYTGLGRLPLRQKGDLARLGLSYGVTPDLSFGATLRYLRSRVGLNGPALPGLLDGIVGDLDLQLLNLGVVAQWDRRDDTVYPTSGSNLAFNADHGTTISGFARDYQKAYATFDLYRPQGASGVFAGRLALCAASRGTPFFDLCSLGGTDNFRGFAATEYLDRRLASVQVAYRHQFGNRIGGAAFAGAGWTGNSVDTLTGDGPHVAGGLGLRYRVSQKYPVDLSIDGTINDQDETQLYIYVGQRF